LATCDGTERHTLQDLLWGEDGFDELEQEKKDAGLKPAATFAW
jgi:hypothetical protein